MGADHPPDLGIGHTNYAGNIDYTVAGDLTLHDFTGSPAAGRRSPWHGAEARPTSLGMRDREVRRDAIRFGRCGSEPLCTWRTITHTLACVAAFEGVS